MFRETQTHLGHVYQSHPTFEVEFRKCVNESETIEEFESRWEILLGQYYLMDDGWMQSVYNARRQWVPVYVRDTFFGELFDEGSEGTDLYFNGFITADTTLEGLIKQYEIAVASWHQKELQADEDTSNTMPMLKTPSPMEKQAANVYTRKIFSKFQEELVETLANPEAMKFVEEGAKSIHVYNVAMNALQEAAEKVAVVKNEGNAVTQAGSLANGDKEVASGRSLEEKVRKIHELTAELENTNKRCEVYRANLLAVLKDMEDQKLKLSVKAQNARLSLRE
ncbi:Protein FAR1-RELATED SEQUENCE 9 [Bienertia sinuspersici]